MECKLTRLIIWVTSAMFNIYLMVKRCPIFPKPLLKISAQTLVPISQVSSGFPQSFQANTEGCL